MSLHGLSCNRHSYAWVVALHFLTFLLTNSFALLFFQGSTTKNDHLVFTTKKVQNLISIARGKYVREKNSMAIARAQPISM